IQRAARCIAPFSRSGQCVKSTHHRGPPLENPYNILGVSPTASAEAIKKAYELLSDPKKRADYNQSLNNRIIIDPEKEALSLWNSLFNRCGIILQHNSSP